MLNDEQVRMENELEIINFLDMFMSLFHKYQYVLYNVWFDFLVELNIVSKGYIFLTISSW
jgi:hypothetical protein